MHFQSEFCTNALQRMQRIAENLRPDRLNAIASAHAMSTIDSILSDLGRQVTNNDHLGISVGTEEELIFRTARLIIETQLDSLEVVLRRIIADSAPAPPTAHVRRSFLEALLPAKAELWRITRIWLPYRRSEPTMRDPSYAAAYRLALRAAFDELHRMDEIPSIERLLYRGVASVQWPEIAKACEQTLVAIHVRVDVERVRQHWAARNRWARAVGSR